MILYLFNLIAKESFLRFPFLSIREFFMIPKKYLSNSTKPLLILFYLCNLSNTDRFLFREIEFPTKDTELELVVTGYLPILMPMKNHIIIIGP